MSWYEEEEEEHEYRSDSDLEKNETEVGKQDEKQADITSDKMSRQDLIDVGVELGLDIEESKKIYDQAEHIANVLSTTMMKFLALRNLKRANLSPEAYAKAEKDVDAIFDAVGKPTASVSTETPQ
jgi:flagellar hook-length control protein FliK